VFLKETLTKEQKDECGGVRSKYDLEQCRRYADHLRQTDQGITNPGGVAMTVYRTGEADRLIEDFLESEIAQVERQRCPDCEGRSFKEVKGVRWPRGRREM